MNQDDLLSGCSVTREKRYLPSRSEFVNMDVHDCRYQPPLVITFTILIKDYLMLLGCCATCLVVIEAPLMVKVRGVAGLHIVTYLAQASCIWLVTDSVYSIPGRTKSPGLVRKQE